jgi:hypothetical protein
MGYHKQAAIAADDLNWFLESARAGTIDEYYWSLEGTPTSRMMAIDTRGTLEEHTGLVYRFEDVAVFVPDHIFGIVQPIVEQLPYKKAKPAAVLPFPATDEAVGYHGLNMSDL